MCQEVRRACASLRSLSFISRKDAKAQRKTRKTILAQGRWDAEKGEEIRGRKYVFFDRINRIDRIFFGEFFQAREYLWERHLRRDLFRTSTPRKMREFLLTV